MKRAKTIFFLSLGVLWMILVPFFYFFNLNWRWPLQLTVLSSHRYYYDSLMASLGVGVPDRTPGPVLFIVGGIIFLFIANLLYDRFVEKKKELKFSFTPFIFFLFFSIIFFLVYNRWIAYFGFNKPIRYESVFVKYSLLCGELFVIFIPIIAFGSKLLKVCKVSRDNLLDQFLLSCAIGISFIVLVSFFLGAFGLYALRPFLILTIIIFIFSWREAFWWVKKIFIDKIQYSGKYFEAKNFYLLFIMVIIAHNALDLIRPTPIGFDDMGVYINNAQQMSIYGHLLNGIMSYYWELLSGLGLVIFANTTLMLWITFFGGILALFALYSFIKDYLTCCGYEQQKVENYSLLVCAIFYSLPAIFFQSAKDMKVDLPALFFSIMALSLFIEWRRRIESAKTYQVDKYFIFAALFAGFGLAIKYTNLLFIGTLVCYLVYLTYRRYKLKITKYYIVLLFILICLLPVLPISVRNIYQTRSLAIQDIRFGDRKTQLLSINPPFSDKSIASYKEYMKKEGSGDHEEVGRYIGFDSGVRKYMLLPFRLLQNSLISGPYVDMGYLLFLFVPLGFVFSWIRRRKKGQEYYVELAGLALLYWVAWLFSASGIIWYGLAGIPFLMLLLIEGYDQASRRTVLRLFSNILIAIGLLSALLFRTTVIYGLNSGIDPVGLAYARGDLNKEELVRSKFETYLKPINIINEDIAANQGNPPKVYRVGTFYKYFIKNNDVTVIDDQMLDQFAFSYQDNDSKKELERFHNNNIKYIIVDKTMYRVDKTPEKSYQKKFEDFMVFIQKNSGEMKLLSDPFDENVLIVKL